MASSFTAVGLSRTSIGPAISVIDRGVAGLRSSDITATAASVCTQGWQTARICAPGPDLLEEADQVVHVVLDPEPARRQRHLAGVDPVGDVDVVVAQQRLDRAAQQRGEMPRQRRRHQHPRLRRVHVLGEVQQVPERQVSTTSSVTGTSRLPTRTDPMSNPGRMRELEPRDQLQRRRRRAPAGQGRAGRRSRAPIATRGAAAREGRPGAGRSRRASRSPVRRRPCHRLVKKLVQIFLRCEKIICTATTERPEAMAPATLTISSKNYSSWSLRGWLLCRMAGLDFEERPVDLGDPDARQELLLLSPSVLVPRLTHDEVAVWDTLAIAEYLNEIAPEARLLPGGPRRRAPTAGRSPARSIRASTTCARRCR